MSIEDQFFNNFRRWSPETTWKRAVIIENRESPFENPRPSGDNSAVAPPVPIPNTEVKRCSPDGSATIGCARVGRRQNKMPGEVTHRAFCFGTPTRAQPEVVREWRRGAAPT